MKPAITDAVCGRGGEANHHEVGCHLINCIGVKMNAISYDAFHYWTIGNETFPRHG